MARFSYSTISSLLQQPKKLALLIAGVIGVWVLSAILFPPALQDGRDGVGQRSESAADLPIKVETLSAQSRAKSIVLNGVTEPEKLTLVQAETEGKVETIHVEEGQVVPEGELLMQLEVRERKDRVAEASSLLEQREVELNAAEKLYQKGFQSKVRYSQAKAAVESARRQLTQAELDLKFTEIRAPYTGLVEEILVEEGDLVGRGFSTQTVMHFVDLSPLKIVGQVSEIERVKLQKGDQATIRLSTGKAVDGEISYISSLADRDTRTFKVEIALPNPERQVQAGVSAEITLKIDQQMAYEVPSSVLVLDDSGNVGVKRLDEQNRVVFEPVEVLSQSDKGVWIGGLPDQIRLISEGAAFATVGQEILPEESTQAEGENTNAQADAAEVSVNPDEAS